MNASTTTTPAHHRARRTCAELGVCNSRTPACSAAQCHQGGTACPVQQACEVAERTDHTAPQATTEGATLFAVCLAFACVCLLVIVVN